MLHAFLLVFVDFMSTGATVQESMQFWFGVK